MSAVADRDRPVRSALLLLGATFALAACFPETALAPIAALVAQMRDPQRAAPVARVFFIAAALCAFGGVLFRDRLAQAAQRAARGIDAWPALRFWGVVAVTAALLRVAAALALPYEPTSDAHWYHAVAASLARGEGVSFEGLATAFRSPGYPFVLSLFYRVGGIAVGWAWVLGMLCTGVLLVSMYSVARRLHGELTARIATLAACVYPALVLMTAQAMTELLFTAGLFALLAWLLRVEREGWREAAALGMACALLTLVRSAAVGLFALMPLIWWLRSGDTKAYWRAVVVAGLVCAACLLPWMLRNTVELDRFTIGTNAGPNLLVGNHAGASGGYERGFEPPDILRAGRDSNEVEADDLMKTEALRFVREHPLQALAILPRKFGAMYLLETQAVSSNFQGAVRGSDLVRHLLYATSQAAWVLVALLAFGRVSSWRHGDARPRNIQWSGWLLVLYFTAICLVFHGEDRYRLPILPWLLIEAAAAVAGTCFARKAH